MKTRANTPSVWRKPLIKYVLQECTVRQPGIGPAIELGPECGKLIVLTLGINQTIEQQGLSVSIWGSADQLDWGTKPLVKFPQKYYCGMYSILLNLAKHSGVRYIRVHWDVQRWSRRDRTPLFGFYVSLDESGARLKSAVA